MPFTSTLHSNANRLPWGILSHVWYSIERSRSATSSVDLSRCQTTLGPEAQRYSLNMHRYISQELNFTQFGSAGSFALKEFYTGIFLYLGVGGAEKVVSMQKGGAQKVLGYF